MRFLIIYIEALNYIRNKETESILNDQLFNISLFFYNLKIGNAVKFH